MSRRYLPHLFAAPLCILLAVAISFLVRPRPKRYIVVHFHADGGAACCDGRRVFPNTGEGQVQAHNFADKRRAEPGHLCGP